MCSTASVQHSISSQPSSFAAPSSISAPIASDTKLRQLLENCEDSLSSLGSQILMDDLWQSGNGLSDSGNSNSFQDTVANAATAVNNSSSMVPSATPINIEAPLNDVSQPPQPQQQQQKTQQTGPTQSSRAGTKRSASDSLIDDLETWCNFELNENQQQQAAQASSSSFSEAAASASSVWNKRRRIDAMIDAGSQQQQQQPVSATQQRQQQDLPYASAGKPSTTTKKNDSSSFADLLQVFDDQELKEAIATGSIFDDVAAQSVIPGCATYAADVTADQEYVSMFNDLGIMPKMPSSIMGTSTHTSGSSSSINMPKMPSSTLGSSNSRHSSTAIGSNMSNIPHGYEMIRQDDAKIPAETRQQPSQFSQRSSESSNTSYPQAQPQQQQQQQEQQEQPQQADQIRFLESMEFSDKTEQLLREWDRSMGLKFCHSKTMLKTSKSRKQLMSEATRSASTLLYLKRMSGDTVSSSKPSLSAQSNICKNRTMTTGQYLDFQSQIQMNSQSNMAA